MDVNEILGRLMTYAGAKNDTALAKMLGYKNQSTIGNWRQKNRPELGKILEVFPEIDLNWLVRGAEEKAPAGVPLIPVDAVAGYGVEAYQGLTAPRSDGPQWPLTYLSGLFKGS